MSGRSVIGCGRGTCMINIVTSGCLSQPSTIRDAVQTGHVCQQ